MAKAFLKKIIAKSPKFIRDQYDKAKEEKWQKRCERIRAESEIDLQKKYSLALKTLKSELGDVPMGDYLEFGIYLGQSMICMHRAAQEEKVDHFRFIGYDSFEGLPDDDNEIDKDFWEPGTFAAGMDIVKRNLTKANMDWDKIVLVKGWYNETCVPETNKKHNIKKAGIIMMDCDLYSSTKEALDYCKDLILDKSIIFFDDWNSAAGQMVIQNKGQFRAFNEFMEANKQFVAKEMPQLNYLTQDPSGKNYAKVYLVERQK